MDAIWKLYVKAAWCILIHLTDVIMREELESLLRDIDNSIEDIWKRKGQIVVVDDVMTQDCTDWKESTGKMKTCQPWISYCDLFPTTPVNSASSIGDINDAQGERGVDIISVNEQTENNAVSEGMSDLRLTDQIELTAS
jgi:hypothetical protein